MQKLFLFFIYSVVCTTTNSQPNEKGVSQPNSNRVFLHSLSRQIELLNDNTYTDPQLIMPISKGWVPSNWGMLSFASKYPIISIDPINNSKETVSLSSIGNITLIDARVDTKKIGFLPVRPDLQKIGYNTIAFKLKNNLNSWLKENYFERDFELDSNSKRTIVVVLNKFWFSSSVNERISYANPKLLTTLHYDVNLYTSTDTGYYRQKKIKGSFISLYDKGSAYNHLTDSLLILLKKEFASTNFLLNETEANRLSPIAFTDYYNTKIINTSSFETIPKGVYETYADFLEKKVQSDSIEMDVKYTNKYQKRSPLYACHLSAFKDGVHLPVNKSWGYYDGRETLFLNTGDGFFIRLIHSTKDYLFIFLKNIGEDKINQSILETIQIGGSPYTLLKNYTNVYSLTFKLDIETGILF